MLSYNDVIEQLYTKSNELLNKNMIDEAFRLTSLLFYVDNLGDPSSDVVKRLNDILLNYKDRIKG